jgi:hypothetical protein
MRRVGRFHVIADETHQAASLAASWLNFTKTQAAAAYYFDRLFRSG